MVYEIATSGLHKVLDVYEELTFLRMRLQRKLGVYRITGEVLIYYSHGYGGFKGKEEVLEALIYEHGVTLRGVYFDALHQAIETPEMSTLETAGKRFRYAKLAFLSKLAALAA